MKDDKPTSFDIAYRAGVSQSTVSRALRDSPLVNEETRLKVQAIAKELNYKVDKNARNLRSQETKTIALLLCEDHGTGDSLINPFFLSMLGSITRATANPNAIASPNTLIDGSATWKRPSSRTVSNSGWPPTISPTSKLVPPISAVRMFS